MIKKIFKTFKIIPGNQNLIFFIHRHLDCSHLPNHAQRLLANTQSKFVLNPVKTLLKYLLDLQQQPFAYWHPLIILQRSKFQMKTNLNHIFRSETDLVIICANNTYPYNNPQISKFWIICYKNTSYLLNQIAYQCTSLLF